LTAALKLTEEETRTLSILNEIQAKAGSHSPSRFTLQDSVPGLEIKIDACFLSNPYATDLFIDRLTIDLLETGQIRELLEFYPSQNQHIASLLAPTVGVDEKQIFVCNGAVEAIQAGLHQFAGKRVAVILPTFSPYYEYLRPDQECVFYKLSPENDFELDCDDFVKFVSENEVDTVCLINPNNPNGGYIPADRMRNMLREFESLQLVILDAAGMDNVMLVKSMSKDFGIAGVRAGYAIMSPDRLELLLRNGYLWNVSGLTEFFFRLFKESEFQESYAQARLRYLDEAHAFFKAMEGVEGLRAFPTMANFRLVQLDDSVPIEILVPLLLIRHGVYVRDCRDKVGLEGAEYLRVAARKDFENEGIVAALNDVIAECREAR